MLPWSKPFLYCHRKRLVFFVCFSIFPIMAKLPLPSGISWLCHFVCPELRPGVAHRSRRYVLACQRLAARSACVCVCVYQQRDAARCKVWPSASLSFHFSLLAAEVHVTECPRRQTTLSLSLNCMLCILFFFFPFCVVDWGQSCIFASCCYTICCDCYSSVVSQSNHIESFHVNYLFWSVVLFTVLAVFMNNKVLAGSRIFFSF